MKFAIVNLMVAVAFLHEMNGVESKLQYITFASSVQLYEDGDIGAVNCTNTVGNVCSNNATECGSVFLCLPNMPTPFKSPCPTGQTCNEGKCSSVKSAVCEYGVRTFKCNTQGMYPEPSSCKKFNFCVPDSTDPLKTVPTPIAATCEYGWGYNPLTTSCDKPLLKNNCAVTDRPVPTCLTLGQNGVVKNNPAMYYICMPYSDTDQELYPSIFKCPRNTRYIGNFTCR